MLTYCSSWLYITCITLVDVMVVLFVGNETKYLYHITPDKLYAPIWNSKRISPCMWSEMHCLSVIYFPNSLPVISPSFRYWDNSVHLHEWERRLRNKYIIVQTLPSLFIKLPNSLFSLEGQLCKMSALPFG